MTAWSNEMNTLVELITRVLCDSWPKNPTDGVYLYCQTESNQQSVFQTARSLLDKSMTAQVLILQSMAMSGYPGFAKWNEQLQESGFLQSQIQGVEIGETETLNTLIESKALVRFALQKHYRSIIIVAPPFQQLRAVMTAVTVLLSEYPQLLIYSYPAVAEPWLDETLHSQGTLRAMRSELIHEELERIKTYQKKGDLFMFEQIVAYLNKRETMV
jgi:hypothetical protein